MWHRTLEEFDDFFMSLKKAVGVQIHKVFEEERHKPPKERKLITFVSDELWQYFYRIAKLVFGVPIACGEYGLEHNNNPVERHNQDILIKQRYK